jgi:Holliday junction resolvase RusA-like endonuclease
MNKLIEVILPPYAPPKNAWRDRIHAVVASEMTSKGVSYRATEQLAVEVCFFMNDGMLGFHDIDNRLKDVFDALQGRAGGAKSVRRLQALIPNDKQVYRATVEKCAPPPGVAFGGTLAIHVLDAR